MSNAVLQTDSGRIIAKININRIIHDASQTSSSGKLCHFTLLSGELQSYWHHQKPIILRYFKGQKQRLLYVRIIALPKAVNDDGILELLAPTIK